MKKCVIVNFQNDLGTYLLLVHHTPTEKLRKIYKCEICDVKLEFSIGLRFQADQINQNETQGDRHFMAPFLHKFERSQTGL